MKRRVLAILAALALVFGLTSCESPSEVCAEAGGRYEQTGTMPVTTWVNTGKVQVPITNYMPIFECIEGPR